MLCRPSAAQQPRPGVVQLTVEDELGGALVGAKVTLVAVATQQTYEGVSDESGRARFDKLQAGEYTVTATSPGFKTLERRLAVGTDRPTSLKLQLRIDVTESVEVSQRKRPLPQREKVEDNADAVPIDHGVLEGVPMPVGSDSIVEFLSRFLTPTVGKPTIILDGQEVDSLHLPPKAIKQIVVNRNPYAAEYRRPGRARIEVVSESGSPSHNHGNVMTVFSNSAMSARGPFMQDKPDLRQWQGDMGFGGPLQLWKGSYLFSGSVNDNRAISVVNALKPEGAFNDLVPARQRNGFWRGRLDFGPSNRIQFSFKYDYEHQNGSDIGVGGLALPELAHNSLILSHTVRFTAHTIFSASFVNDTRVSMQRETGAIGNDANGQPLIVVQGAFQGGVDQNFTRRREVNTEVQDIATYVRGAQTMRFGGRLKPQFTEITDAANFGGTFEFSNLEMFRAAQPFVYRVNQGTPHIEYRPSVADAFFQDEIKLRPDFSLMLGARYDFEAYLRDYNNLGPRVAFAFAPGQKKTSVRGGVGVFYEHLGQGGIQQALMFDGSRTHELIITDPSYPNPFAEGTATADTPDRYQFAKDFSAGKLIQSSVSLERELSRKTSIAIEYTRLWGVDLFRVRDLNAPLPGTDVRPDTAFLPIIQIESAGRMRSNSLNVTFHAGAGAFKGSAIYTYAKTYNDTPGANASGSLSFTLPANNYDPGAEWGRADFDIRHRFHLAGVLQLPFGFRVGSILELKTGEPYEITTGFDDNGDGDANDRPAGVRRNAGQMPGYGRLDLRLTKVFNTLRPLESPTDKPGKLSINLDLLNALNRANYSQFVGVRSSPLFGQAIAAEQARKIQLAVSYNF
jgi:hypothetical protein